MQNFFKLLKKGDYEIIGQAYPVAAVVGFLGYILFYFSDIALGMYENIYLRIIVSFLFIQLFHFKKDFNFLRKAAVEIILAVCLPLFYSYFFFCNNQHTNWAAGFIFCGFTYGFMTGKVNYTLTVYPLFILTGYFLYDHFFIDAIGGTFRDGVDIILLTVTTAFLSSIMKLVLESVLLTYINTESRQLQMVTEKNIQESVDHNVILLKDLRKAKNLNAASKLTGGLIEGFEGMIDVIYNSSSELKLLYREDDLKQKRIDTVLEIVQKSSRLINSIAVFSPDRYEIKSIVNIHHIINNVIKLLNVNSGANITIESFLNADKAVLYGNSEMLEQAFFNLSINALQSMPDGGRLTIRTENNHSDKKLIISFKDHGSGMDDITKANIFKPFFSTKESGRGLGLMMVSETVKKHQGSINVESQLTKGSIFIISLPLNPVT